MLAYTTDYSEQFPVFGNGDTRWNFQFNGFQWDIAPTDSTAALNLVTQAPITASLYLLVKYADVSPGAFVCKASGQTKFELDTNQNNANPGQNHTTTVGITNALQVWDFGGGDSGGPTVSQGGKGPWDYCSYSFQQPYRVTGGGSGAGGTPMGLRSSNPSLPGIAMMADASPWFERGTIKPPDTSNGPYDMKATDWDPDSGEPDKEMAKLANSVNHGRDGQNVLYGDGHVSFEANPFVGVEKDNIYTAWQAQIADPPEPVNKQGGVKPATSYQDGKSNISQSEEDSFLAN